MKKLNILVGLAVLFSGCASRLETYNSQEKLTKGIPFVTPVLVKITEETTYEVAPGGEAYANFCTTETDVKFQVLPVGEQCYIAFKPAEFGKGEFTVEYNDAGTLKSVSLNSEATAAASDVGSLLQAILPYIAAKPIPAAPAAELRAREDTAQNIKARSCLKKGTRVIRIERARIE